jgi:hypothetical protein
LIPPPALFIAPTIAYRTTKGSRMAFPEAKGALSSVAPPSNGAAVAVGAGAVGASGKDGGAAAVTAEENNADGKKSRR